MLHIVIQSVKNAPASLFQKSGHQAVIQHPKATPSATNKMRQFLYQVEMLWTCGWRGASIECLPLYFDMVDFSQLSVPQPVTSFKVVHAVFYQNSGIDYQLGLTLCNLLLQLTSLIKTVRMRARNTLITDFFIFLNLYL